MKTRKQTSIHTKAFLSNFELACEWGILTVIGDIVWLTHDILANGMSLWYAFIGMTFILGIVGLVYVLYRHHKAYTHRYLNKKNWNRVRGAGNG